MFNDVLLPRLDSIEKRTEERLDKLDKRVSILQGLFATLNASKEQNMDRDVVSAEVQTKAVLASSSIKSRAQSVASSTVPNSSDEQPHKRYSGFAGRAAFNRSKTQE